MAIVGNNVLRPASSRRPVDGPINAAAGGQPDATFPRTVRKAFKAITSATQETILLRIPWGPRLSVLFDPRGATGIAGGLLIVYAIVESSQLLLSRTTITLPTQPLRVLEEAACDTYLVTAILGTPLPPGTTQVESYVYAGTYAGERLMDATFLTTLRALFPRVSLRRPVPEGDGEMVTLGAVVDVAVNGRAIVVTLEDGVEIRFFANLASWRAMSAHLRTGDLTFDDPELGLRRLAEILGTRREHLDA